MFTRIIMTTTRLVEIRANILFLKVNMMTIIKMIVIISSVIIPQIWINLIETLTNEYGNME